MNWVEVNFMRLKIYSIVHKTSTLISLNPNSHDVSFDFSLRLWNDRQYLCIVFNSNSLNQMFKSRKKEILQHYDMAKKLQWMLAEFGTWKAYSSGNMECLWWTCSKTSHILNELCLRDGIYHLKSFVNCIEKSRFSLSDILVRKLKNTHRMAAGYVAIFRQMTLLKPCEAIYYTETEIRLSGLFFFQFIYK